MACGTKYIITRYRLPRGTTPLFVHFFIKSHNAGLYLTSVSFDLEVERLILTINHTGRLTGSFRPANIEIVNRIYDKTPQFGTWGYKVHAIHSMLMWIALLWLYLCSVVWNVSAHSRAFICITILGSAANIHIILECIILLLTAFYVSCITLKQNAFPESDANLFY